MRRDYPPETGVVKNSAPALREAPPAKPEPPGEAAERVAYGVLVAAPLENGLVKTLQDAVDVLKKFSAPAGVLGEQWLSEQEGQLRPKGRYPTDV